MTQFFIGDIKLNTVMKKVKIKIQTLLSHVIIMSSFSKKNFHREYREDDNNPQQSYTVYSIIFVLLILFSYKCKLIRRLKFTIAVTWLKYCRNGVKLYPINQSIHHNIFLFKNKKKENYKINR